MSESSRINERVSRYGRSAKSNVLSLTLSRYPRGKVARWNAPENGLLLLKTQGWRYVLCTYMQRRYPPTFNILSSNRCSDIKRTSPGAGYVHPRIMWPCLTINFQRYPPATFLFSLHISWTRRRLEFFSPSDLLALFVISDGRGRVNVANKIARENFG